MIFQTVNRTDPLRIFLVVKNSYSTATITNGQWVGWDIVTDKDGIGVTKVSGIVRHAVAGCVVQSIAHNDFGLLQVWGYKDDALTKGGSGLDTSKTTEGSILYFGTSALAPQVLPQIEATLSGDEARFPCGIVIDHTTAAKATSATSSTTKVLIRCLG